MNDVTNIAKDIFVATPRTGSKGDMRFRIRGKSLHILLGNDPLVDITKVGQIYEVYRYADGLNEIRISTDNPYLDLARILKEYCNLKCIGEIIRYQIIGKTQLEKWIHTMQLRECK